MDYSERPDGIFQSARFWQGWSLVATLVALYALVVDADFSEPAPGPDYVAIVGDAGAEPMWVIGANLAEGVLTARAVTAKSAGGDLEYRLWLVRGGSEPLAIGTLPVDRKQASIKVSDTVARLLDHGRTIGVSRAAAGEEPDAGAVSFDHQASLNRV